MATTPGAAPRGYDHDDASTGRAHDVRSLAPVTTLPPGLRAWEERECRAQHREACIAAVKRSGDYIAAVAQHLTRPVTPDPRQPEVSKRAWEKSVRQWRLDLKALVADGLAGRVDDEPLRVPWPSELSQPMYVPLPASLDEAAFFLSDLNEPLHVPCLSERGANEECNEEVWQRRSAHRAAGVAAVKRSPDYILAAADPNVARPRTPDPTNRKLSKRAWERGMQQWRMDLKIVVVNLDLAPGHLDLVVDAIIVVDR